MIATKFRNTLFVLLFSFIAIPCFAQQITSNGVKTSLQGLIHFLENDYNYLFSYKEEDIQNLFVSPPRIADDVQSFLKTSLAPTDLTFELVKDNYIILTKKKVLSQSEIEAGWPTVCGIVSDASNETALAFASVYLKVAQRGTSSDENGGFEIKIDPTLEDSIVVSYVGYQEQKYAVVDLLNQPCKNIALSYFEFIEDFVVVREYLTDGVTLNDHGGVINLKPNQVGALPGQAEPDVLKTIRFLPGVISPDGSTGNLCVRGGTSDQNLILWEEIPIYHTAHYFGMISAFNPFIIDNASVYRGGFDANYGGRISSVIDLKSDGYNRYKTNFGAGINFLNAYTYGKFTTKNKKLSGLYSIRRSINDVWNSPTFESITKRIHQGVVLQFPTNGKLPESIRIKDQFNFFDSNAKLSYSFSDKDKVSIAALFANNNFESKVQDNMIMQEQSDTLNLESIGASFSWDHHWNSRFSSKATATYSDYHYKYDFEIKSLNDPNRKDGIKKNTIIEQQFHLSNSYTTERNQEIKFGYQINRYDVSYDIQKRLMNRDHAKDSNDNKANVQVLYATFNSNKTKKFGLDGGIRWSHFQKESDLYFEPRIRLWYQQNKNLNFYINAGQYYQFLSQLIEIQGDDSSIETPVWDLTGNREFPVLNSVQFVFGMVYDKKSWLIDFQSYYKKINGLSSLSTGFDEGLGTKNPGESPIQGIDLLIKKKWKNYRSWLSYSISKTDYKFPSFFDKDFPSPIDQRHTFHWVNAFHFGNFQCSIGWKLASGKPYSLIENYEIRVDQNNGQPDINYISPLVDSYNSENLPFEHQLDASFSYQFQAKGSPFNSILSLSLFNIYSQRNTYNRSFFIDNKPNENASLIYLNKVNMGFTPNLSFRVNW